MTATFDDAVADPQQTIAELRRQLDACRGALAARNNEFAEQPGILDGDDRLIGEGADEFDLPLGERLSAVSGVVANGRF